MVAIVPAARVLTPVSLVFCQKPRSDELFVCDMVDYSPFMDE
jgi:hypothetical protein